MSLNAVAHKLACVARREKNESFLAAVATSFWSSQQHCGVLLNVRRKLTFRGIQLWQQKSKLGRSSTASSR
jgi:hypothetical protein